MGVYLDFTAGQELFERLLQPRGVGEMSAVGPAQGRRARPHHADLEPMAVVHYPALGGVVLTFAGLDASVDGQIAHASALAARYAAACEPLDGPALERCFAFESAVRSGGEWRWTARTNAARARGAAAPAVGLALEVAYPTLGVTLGSADDSAPMEELIVSRGNSIVFRAMPPRARGRVDAWGEPPPSFPLMRALKANFDPKGLCNPGRFVGGL